MRQFSWKYLIFSIIASIILVYAITLFKNKERFLPIVGIKAGTGNSRLGDSLSIIHTTIYLSQKYNIPFLYCEEFKNSEQLVLNREIEKWKPEYEKNFKKIVRVFREKDINLDDLGTLYDVRHNFVKNLNADEQAADR